ncbi:MAG: hypothetical protein FJ276_35720, partial [Planctomycetes bacterium]|nr:hypothetical protein [Planctomycetota bacterium]
VAAGEAANLRVVVEDGSPVTAAQVEVTVLVPEFREYESHDVPHPVDDHVTVYSEIHVAESLTIQDVNVRVDITHTYCADLDVFLIAPDGTRVELFTDVGGSGDNFSGTILDDEAMVSITEGSSPFTGRYRPESPLSRLAGREAAGTWRLEVRDDSSGDRGQLNAWALEIVGAAPGSEAARTTFLYDDGLHNDGDPGDGVYGNDVLLGTSPGNFLVRYRVSGSSHTGAAFTRTSQQTVRVTPGDRRTFWTSTDVPRPIDDYTITRSELTVAQPLLITDVDVELDITHTYCGDLDVSLIAPDGMRVNLISRVGGSSDNFSGTVLDDEAETRINQGTAPFSGSYRPSEPLAAFDGRWAQGTWALEVHDRAGGDRGQLNHWALSIAAPSLDQPRLSVFHGGTLLPNQGALDFGSVALATLGPERVLTVRNDGAENLNLSGFVVPGGFRLTYAPYGVVPPGETTSLAFRLDTNQVGLREGVMRFWAAHAGTDAVEYSLNLSGRVTSGGPANQPPRIGWLMADMESGVMKLLAGDVRDADGFVAQLTYYVDVNGQPGLQTGPTGDRILGVHANPAEQIVHYVPLDELDVGLATFYAQATDDRGGKSAVAYDTQVVAGDGPVLLLLEAGPRFVQQPDDIRLQTAALEDSNRPVA